MELQKPGRDVLTTPWSGRCHTCRAEFVTTGEEVKQVTGQHHAEITRFDCTACGAKKNVYLEPKPPRPVTPPPLPKTEEELAAEVAEQIARQQRLEARIARIQQLVDTPTPDRGCPGFISFTQITFRTESVWTEDGIVEMDYPGDEFFFTTPRLIPTSSIHEVSPGYCALGVTMGNLNGMLTVETYDVLVARVAAAQAHLITPTP